MRATLFALALFLLGPWLAPQHLPQAKQPGQNSQASLGRRLLGPFASLAASIEWVRFDQAAERGDFSRAYVIANRALALDPGSPHGWDIYASHLIFQRGGALSEPNPQRQVDWIRAGLDVLAEGTQVSRAAGTLSLIRGQILALYVAEIAHGPDGLPWPGGAAAALHEGILALERAAELGHPRAHERKHQAIQAFKLRGRR